MRTILIDAKATFRGGKQKNNKNTQETETKKKYTNHRPLEKQSDERQRMKRVLCSIRHFPIFVDQI